jgi:CRISPR/Cas system CSM-associated protein Csm3 (group 7 of RAMP superfamily)
MIDDNFLNNKVTARYRAMGCWKALTGLHPGGQTDDFETNADMALIRASDGSFLIPGASIAGAARSHLAGPYTIHKDERKDVFALFGGPEYASLLTVLDARLRGTATPHTRDGVHIQASTGIAQDGAKYDFEVLPAGTQFEFEFQLVIYENLPHGVMEGQVCASFLEMLRAFQDGHIRMGARTRRGLGRGRLEDVSIHRLDMTNPDHVRAWLDRDWNKGQSISPASDFTIATGQRLRIEADLKLKTSLLIRSAGDHPAAPDMVHLTEGNKNLLTGTSLAGALRQRCLRIANTMGLDGPTIVASMFGPAPQTQSSLRASRVWVQEQELDAGSGGLNVQGRVSIDRFTGGALESHLFDQAAFWPAERNKHVSIVVELELQRPPEPDQDGNLASQSVNPFEAALLLQAFKDLWLGDLPIGGEVGAGRGVFEGVSATLSYPGKTSLTLKAIGTGIRIEQGDWTEWNALASLPKPEATHD